MKLNTASAAAALLLAALSSGCTLRSDVVVTPVFLLPSDVRRPGTTVVELQEIGDYPRAIAFAPSIDARERPAVRELIALGTAEMAAARLDDARRHLRQALNLKPSYEQIADIAWALSQVEYLADNFAAAHEWAQISVENGISIRQWHLDYLKSLAEVPVYRVEQPRIARLDMKMGNPDIPRVPAQLNGEPVTAVIDTGAVMSVISDSLAEKIGLKILGDYRGTFLGLLGEPIPVRFGLIETMVLGELKIENIPVAIMPDKKLSFVVMNREPYQMDFLLGANLLKQFRAEFDYRHGFLTLEPVVVRQPAADQNLFFVTFRPFVHATINRKGWYLFIVDTGSEITFLNDGLVDSSPIRRFPRYHGAMLQGLGGAKKRGEKIENVEIGIDTWAGAFKDIPLYTTEDTRAFGIIGQNFLKNFRVVFDFEAMRLDLYRDRGPFRSSVFEGVEN